MDFSAENKSVNIYIKKIREYVQRGGFLTGGHSIFMYEGLKHAEEFHIKHFKTVHYKVKTSAIVKSAHSSSH